MRQHYAVPVYSVTLGLYGRCDVVETGPGIAIPIEHKIGSYRPGGPADIQVAAQVLCLREMLDVNVPHGEVFTHADRRRHHVTVDESMLSSVRHTVDALRTTLAAPALPTPPADQRCRRCSLLNDCLPHALVRPTGDTFTPRELGHWDD
jgi:CRISPR-associated exonuclease Cas4